MKKFQQSEKIQRERDRKHGRESEKKMKKIRSFQQSENIQRLEINNKEWLKNNILIKIEIWDVGEIVKWYGIMIKWCFRMVKQDSISISQC